MRLTPCRMREAAWAWESIPKRPRPFTHPRGLIASASHRKKNAKEERKSKKNLFSRILHMIGPSFFCLMDIWEFLFSAWPARLQFFGRLITCNAFPHRGAPGVSKEPWRELSLSQMLRERVARDWTSKSFYILLSF